MQHGFIKVAAITPQIRVADPYYNAEKYVRRLQRQKSMAQRSWYFRSCV